MSETVVIKINDARLVVAGSGRLLHHEPGFAVVDGREILTGHAAFARSRMLPRHTSHRHWSSLSAEPGSAGIAGADTAAELAYAQLDRLWAAHRKDARSAVLVVPNDYSNHALGILLGLAEECGMPVGGMVDAAVAASVRPYPGRQLLYVDAGLHSVAVTPLEQGNEAASLQSQRIDTGLASVMDAFARRIAELFVLETRFDPLHDAPSEQRLYDGLAGWLEALKTSETTPVEIEYRGENFAIELERRNLLGAAQGFLRALQQLVAQMRDGDAELAVQLSDKVAGIPGVVEALERLDDATIICQPPGHAALAMLDAAAAIAASDGQVRLYRHLPWREAPEAEARPPRKPAAVAPAAAEPRPTHVVYRGVAYRVNGAGVTIGRSADDGEGRKIVVDDAGQGVSRSHCILSVSNGELRLRDLSRYGTFVNERRIEGETVLKPADVIRIGSPGAELTAIRLDLSEEVGDGA